MSKKDIIPEDLVCKWIPNGEGNDLHYLPPGDYSAIVQHFNIMTEQGARDAINLSVKELGLAKIRPDVGVLHMHKRRHAMPGDIIATHIPGKEAREAYLEEQRQRSIAIEKAAIAAKLKERQRKRDLEKLVAQELIDSGELFGEQAKRPPIPREVVDAVYRRDKGRCVYCGSTENLQLDHIIPFSKGGATTLENLQLLCQKCNLEKSNHIG
jgi:hypothetical protein